MKKSKKQQESFQWNQYSGKLMLHAETETKFQELFEKFQNRLLAR